MGKVKIVGYAKKEFYDNGIEYRDYSPDLVGNQFTNSEGTPVFTSGNFNITTNLDTKDTKIFVTNEYTNFISLDTLSVSDVEVLPSITNIKTKLNLDFTDVTNFAFFGSLKEFIRVSLENIIITWPASLYVSSIDVTDPSITGDTISNYIFDVITNTSTFDVDTERVINTFDINYLTGGTIIDTYNETNDLRNLTVNYGSYVISNTYGEFDVSNFIGASALTNSTMTLTVNGNPFPNFGSEVLDYHIKPNENKVETFFLSLNEFENNLLNRLTIPKYSGTFKVSNESNTGAVIVSNRKIIWPVSDGYNIDFNSSTYISYVDKLIQIANTSDELKSNLMVRFLVSSSISEFDSISDINGTYEATNGQKMTNTLNIYGREFDELRKYAKGISFANVVTYDGKNNTPDIVLKNLARVLGWELTSSISEVDLAENYLSLNPINFVGHSRGLSDAEADIELWRRVIMNTPWLWKSKGTRKAIEFLFKFIGTPDGLVTFNEYLYVADKPVDIDVLTDMMEHFNDTSDITNLNVDSEGFPKTLKDNNDMYFQKAGLWYRTTGGNNPDIDVLDGNNPHIGPYDGGQEYINQFTQCLVPNFVGGITEEVGQIGDVNLFTNFDNGTFDQCCDGNILVTLETNKDFDALLTSNINQFTQNEPVTETGCTIENTWVIIAALTGNTFYTSPQIITTGTTALLESEYVNELYNLSGTTQLSATTMQYNSSTSEFLIISTDEDCENELLDTYFKVEVQLSSTFDCLDEGVTGLIAFNVSNSVDDGCNPSGALSTSLTLYHNGVNVLPITGDTIYTDSLGVTPYVSLPDSHRYMGGNFADIDTWLETDASGVRVAIVCPEIVCGVTLGTDFTGGIPGSELFYIDGVTQSRTVTVSATLSNVIKDPANGEFACVIKGKILTESNPIKTWTTTVVLNGGVVYDYEAIVSTSSFASSYKVTFSIIDIDGECIDGPTSKSLTLVGLT